MLRTTVKHRSSGSRRQLDQRNQALGEPADGKALVEGFQERSRLKMMEVLRRFIAVDNQEVAKLRDLEKTLESLSVVESNITLGFPQAVVREGADELTLPRDNTV